jgi:hypothetical protein
MAEWGFSRCLAKAGKQEEALAALARAEQEARRTDDREQKYVDAWSALMRAEGKPEADRAAARDTARRVLNNAIIIYPRDPQLWVCRAEVETNRLRAVPFYLAALRLDPAHPGRSGWDLSSPPAPSVTPAPTKPVAKLETAPKFFPGLGNLSHRVTTTSSLAQAYYEQGLRCWHAYVTPTAIPDFQYAANLDPTCAMAYWGLSLALPESGGVMASKDAANRALELAANATDRERRFCAARVLELSGDGARESFLDALDSAIAAYPEDVELWIWRGKALGKYNGDVPLEGMPYELAAYRMHPEHPSPNHELIHAYEVVDRPVLGWPYTVGFEQSAPNMPHAHHMMAHLAMRLGRWDEALRCTRMSVQKSREGFPELEARHHIDVMMRALAHEGLFREALAQPDTYRDGIAWARMLRLKNDLPALAAWAAQREKDHSPDGPYVDALVKLDQGKLDAAAWLVAMAEARYRAYPNEFYRYAEVKGRYLVQRGKPDEGLKLLREAGAKAVKDAGLHSWGGGSYMLEVWGETALRAGRGDEAEEAFLEALAHEHGSVIGALGMQVVSELRGQSPLAQHYERRAAAIWKRADPGALSAQLARLRSLAPRAAATTPVRSGLPVGMRPLPFTSNLVTGPYRGQQHCYICELKEEPVVLVFARNMDPATAELMRRVQQAALKHADSKLFGWFVFLGPGAAPAEARLEAAAYDFANANEATSLAVAALGDPQGPPGYRIAPDADITVLLFRNKKVIANFAYRKADWNVAAADAVLRGLPKLIAAR